MIKKNSWIAALLSALALTALLTGCIDAVVEEEGVTYTEVALGAFNTWGGQIYQRGWAVAGMKFSGAGNKEEIAADLGYKNEDFGKATKLKIEMEDSSHPSGNLDLIWGYENAAGVGDGWIQTGSIPYKKDGNVIIIDLTKMKNYALYKQPTIAKRRLVLQAGGEKADLPFVKKAWLMIPDKVPFVAVKDMRLATSEFAWTDSLTLEGIFTPDDATNQIVNWSIKSWTDGTTTLSLPVPSDPSDPLSDSAYVTARNALFGKVKFKDKELVIRPGVPSSPAVVQEDTEVWDYTTLPPSKIIFTSDGHVITPANPGEAAFTKPWHEDNVIVAADGEDSMGTVVIIATVIDGKKETTSSDAGENFTKEFIVTIRQKPPITGIKVDGATQSTIKYGVYDNGPTGSTINPLTGGGYVVNMKGSNSNTLSYVFVDFGSDTLSDYYVGDDITKTGKIKFKFKGIDGDWKYKDHIRVVFDRGNAANPMRDGSGGGYQQYYWAALSKPGTQEEASITFEIPIGYDTRSNNTTLVPTGNKGALTSILTDSSIYFCILLNNNAVEFEITDIEFVKATP